jgi:glycosyltransferase involved in cell wall biosynthesis
MSASNLNLRGLVVAPQPFFSPRGTPFSVYYRTLVTAQLGAKIDFLTYAEGQDVDIPNVRFIRIPRLFIAGPVRIGPSYLKLFYDIFITLWMVALLLRYRYDFVHAHEESVFIACFLRPLFRFKLIYDMHSSLPQQLENFKFTKTKAIIKLFEILENSSIKAAHAVITICPDLYHYVEKILPNSRKNYLIENSLFSPVNLKVKNHQSLAHKDGSYAKVSEFSKQFKYLIVYAGTLEPYQGIDILVKSISIVVKTNPKVGLAVVGGVPQQVMEMRELTEQLGISKHVIFTGRVSQDIAKSICRMASVLTSPRSSGTNTPLKIYEQLASGIPLVATDIYSHTQVLTPDAAFLVAPDPEAMANGIIEAIDPRGAGPKKATSARNLYERDYSESAYIHKMTSLLTSLKDS